MAALLSETLNTGGVPVAADGTPPGSLLDGTPGQLQYGYMLTGAGSAIGWRNLTGWRSLPGLDLTDAARPLAHGDRAGSTFAQGATVTYDALLVGSVTDKLAALAALEAATPVDGLERALVVDDGAGPELRWARTIARDIPQDAAFRHGPIAVALQWRCADPRRYSLQRYSQSVPLPIPALGLDYTSGLQYEPGLDYGLSSTVSVLLNNAGNVATPPTLTFRGPLTKPTLSTADWHVTFDLTLTAGETLTVDPYEGTVKLNDEADRLYTLTANSSPIDACVLPPGANTATLSAQSGSGDCLVTWRDARL